MGPVTGNGRIIMVKGNNLEKTCRFFSFTSYYNDEKYTIIEEINQSESIIKEQLNFLTNLLL